MHSPVNGIVEITSPYGKRIHPITGESQFHHGIDIRTPFNTPILAVYDGTIRGVKWGEREGLYLWLVDDDTEVIYCHLRGVFVGVGKRVKAGEEIARSGSSGGVTGPHLHIGIKINGQWTDPEKLLKEVS